MAKSKTKKRLEHQLKNNGGFDPRLNRGSWVNGDGVSKQTPTLVSKQRKQERKHKKRNFSSYQDEPSFAF